MAFVWSSLSQGDLITLSNFITEVRANADYLDTNLSCGTDNSTNNSSTYYSTNNGAPYYSTDNSAPNYISGYCHTNRFAIGP